LEKDGWTITDDPFPLKYENLRLQADLGAERTLAAEKAGQKIAVEVKDFDQDSPANELQKLIGQMQLYQGALDDQEPDRALFLAISEAVYDKRFQQPAYQRAVRQNAIKMFIFDEIKEVILQWIKPPDTQTS
jgi:hypothetical protein